MHGLQPVARVRQRAAHDGRERIGEIALLQRLAQVDVDRRRGRRRRGRSGSGHARGLAEAVESGQGVKGEREATNRAVQSLTAKR